MDLEAKLAALEDLSSSDLRDQWQRQMGEVAPRVSPKLLRHALAWELQASVHGGLPRKVQQTLDQFAGAKTRTAAAVHGAAGALGLYRQPDAHARWRDCDCRDQAVA